MDKFHTEIMGSETKIGEAKTKKDSISLKYFHLHSNEIHFLNEYSNCCQ